MTTQEGALICKALGDETRMNILSMLKSGDLCAHEILEHFRISQSTLSYHMKTLCECGIVVVHKKGLWSYYSIERNRLREWMQCINDNFLE